MFWLILLAIPHHHHRHWRRHGRFYHPLYWLTGLAFLELAIWIAALEIAGELLAIWWLLWWASRGLAAAGQAMWEATQPVSAGGPDWRGAVDGARPPWPKRQAVSRLAATFGMSVIGPPHCWHVRSAYLQAILPGETSFHRLPGPFRNFQAVTIPAADRIEFKSRTQAAALSRPGRGPGALGGSYPTPVGTVAVLRPRFAALPVSRRCRACGRRGWPHGLSWLVLAGGAHGGGCPDGG